MPTIAEAKPGQAISTHNAENVLSDGLPWHVVTMTRLSAKAVVALVRELRAEYGMSSSVSNRTFYAVDDNEDIDATTCTLAYTYDDVGFIAVVFI